MYIYIYTYIYICIVIFEDSKSVGYLLYSKNNKIKKNMCKF